MERRKPDEEASNQHSLYSSHRQNDSQETIARRSPKKAIGHLGARNTA